MKRFQKLFSALLCVVMLLSLAAPAAAEETGPTLTVSKPGSVYPDNTVTLYVDLTQPDGIGALDFDLRYDAEVLTLRSASADSSISCSVNDNTAGLLRCSMVSMEGVKNDLRVLTVSFTVSASAPAGDTPVTISVGDAYRASDFAAMSVRGVSSAVTVIERTPQKPSMYVYSQATPATLKQGDVTELRFYTYDTNGFVSGVFDLRYDETLFAFESFALGDALEGGLGSVNSKNPGLVRLAYASKTVGSSGTLFTLRLRAVADVTTQTTVTLDATDLNTESLQDMAPIHRSVNLSLEALPPQPEDHPDLRILAPERIQLGETFDLVLQAEGTSALAAGDFTFTYDPALFEVVSEPTSAPELSGVGMVMVNPNYASGTVRFSFVCEAGLDADRDLIVIPMRAVGAPGSTGTFAASGRNLVDADYHTVVLDYPEASTEIYCDHPSTTTSFVAPTCTEPGNTGDKYCEICGAFLQAGEEIPALGHQTVLQNYREPTVDAEGYTGDEVCEVCGETIRQGEPIPKLKNGLVWEDGELWWYVSGEKVGAGLIEVEGYYYYIRPNGAAVRGSDYYVSKPNGYVEKGVYSFDDEGRMIIVPAKSGLVWEDGKLWYYVDDVKTHAGLILVDGYYYYIKSNGQAVTDRRYYVSNTNGLLPKATYTFDAEGRMTDVPTPKEGLVQENGRLYYYHNNVKTKAGLIEVDGNYYYINSSCYAVAGCEYYVSNTHGLLPAGTYTFRADGTMIVPEPDTRTGLFEENGELVYYVNGEKTHAGLIEIDGSYYYIKSNCTAVRDSDYFVSNTNGLMPRGIYHFNADGTMVV